MNITDELRSRILQPEFPRTATYDAEWLFDSMMGINVLWLAEWASQQLPLRAGMRVLDLGCGKAASSIFLAKEFGVTVWAADLWIAPTDNLRRIQAVGLEDRVLPIAAEAHALPFAEDYFDAVVSFDAYHYFGTDDLYLGYISKFICPGGRLCIVSPSVLEEMPAGPPEWLRPYWNWEFCTFHSPDWWRRHWSKTGLVEIESSDLLARGCELWADWDECCGELGVGRDEGKEATKEAEMLRKDAGRTLGFARVVARRPSQ